MLRDLRYALRMLAKSPGAAAVAVLALALGIGGNAVTFTFVNAFLIRPLPYPELGRIVAVWETLPKLHHRNWTAPANFLDWREQSTAFEYIAAYRGWNANLTGQGDPEQLPGYAVTPEFFAVLGMPPLAGRTFTPAEAQAGNDRVVALSYGLWKRRFARDPTVLGRTLTLNGRAYNVVAIMPPDFDYPLGADIWSPLAFTEAERADRGSYSLDVLARLKPGSSLARAQSEMSAIAGRLARQYPDTNADRGARVQRLTEGINPVTDKFTLILAAAAAFVLLLACANVANLQLARAIGRRKEVAVRLALGAGRTRIARQFLIENLVVAAAGGGLGLLLAFWGVDVARAAIPAQVRIWVAGLRYLEVDGTVLAFTGAVSLVTGVLCGLAPSLQAAPGAVGQALKEGGRSGASERGSLRNVLVVAEVALALVLLVGAGLMALTFRQIAAINAGFNPRNILSVQVALPEFQYREPALIVAFQDEALRRIGALPNVVAAGATGGQDLWGRFSVEGRPLPGPEEPVPVVEAVSPNYFRALGLPLRRGRPITGQDGRGTPPVVVLSESVARHYFPSQDPVGQRVRLGESGSTLFTVAGVVGDVKQWFTGEPILTAHVAARQYPRTGLNILIRTAGDPMNAIAAVREQIRAVDRNLAIFDVKTMEQFMDEQSSGVRISAWTMAIFAVIALVLAASGIYAVISYAVAQRTREIGVRMAVGAGRRDVLVLVVGQALRLALAGIAIGLPAALLLGKFASSLIENVIPLHPAIFAGLTALLASVAALAGYLPARRATRVDPIAALRHE